VKSLLRASANRLGTLGFESAIVFVITRCADVTNLIIIAILGRLFELPEFGAVIPVYSLVMMSALPVAILNNLGAKSISRLNATNEREQARALIAHMLAFVAIGSLIAAGVALLFREYISSRLALPSAGLIWIVIPLMFLAWWRSGCDSVTRGERRYGLLALPYTISPLIALTLTIVFVGAYGFGLYGVFAARAVAWVLTTGALLWLLRSAFTGVKASYREELGVIRDGALPIVLYVISASLLIHFDRLFVRNFLTAESGGYAAIVTLGSIPQLMIAPIVFVVLPYAAAEHVSGRDLRKVLASATLLGLGITMACVTVFAFFGERILGTWNPEFLPYAKYLWPYTLAMGLHGMILTFAQIEMARHRYRFLWPMVTVTITMIVGMYAWRTHFSIDGIIVTLLISRIAILVAMFLDVRSAARIKE
jgi:O-antigen/teichoic acid export membrane protein